MDRLDKLVRICNAYKNGKFGLEELQSRVITSPIPETVSKDFLNSLVEFDNAIEEIIFCSSYLTQFNKACNVVDKLLDAVQREKRNYSTV